MTEQTKGTAMAKVPTDADEGAAGMPGLLEKAKTPQEREYLYALAGALEQSKLIRRASQIVAATEWGQAMSEPRRLAFARYCLALGADPLRHVDLLGGNPFINGDYFRDVIAANPNFDHSADPVWIHDDVRLGQCCTCGKEFGDKPDHGHGIEEVTEENRRRTKERVRRAQLRLDMNADEAAPAICVLALHYKDGRGPFYGIGEVHPGKTAKGNDKDPIGLQSPRATAETRAWREAGEKAEATWFRTHASTLAELEGKLKETYRVEKAVTPREPEAPPGEIIQDPAPEITEIPAAPAAAEDPVERHAPSAICSQDGDHPRSQCGYYKKKAS